METTQELVDLFLRLAPLEGVSLSERLVADEVCRLLSREGIRVVEDNAATLLGGTAGNLLCFPPDFRSESSAIMLTAHLDTVESTAGLRPIVDANSIRSDGTTILGADNRLGLTVLVHLLVTIARNRIPHRNFFVVFTVGEETGLFGAGSVQVPLATTSGAYVFDCSRRPGTYILESVGLHTFSAEFFGKSAHAGVAPEEGVSAIQMACAAVSQLQLGRIDPNTTANVGRIRGGEALNAIPALAVIEGEVRSFSRERIGEQLEAMERVLHSSVGSVGRVAFNSKEEFQPYTLTPDSPLIVDLECAMRVVDLTPHPIRYTGGSDANRYNAKGFPAVNLGIGAQKPHSHEEFVLIEDLVKTYELAQALARARD